MQSCSLQMLWRLQNARCLPGPGLSLPSNERRGLDHAMQALYLPADTSLLLGSWASFAHVCWGSQSTTMVPKQPEQLEVTCECAGHLPASQ